MLSRTRPVRARGRWGRRTSSHTGGPGDDTWSSVRALRAARAVPARRMGRRGRARRARQASTGSGSPPRPGTWRAEFSWQGEAGTASKLASALRGWHLLRFEVTAEPCPTAEGERYSSTPDLGIFHAVTGIHGDILIPEDRLRAALARAAAGREPTWRRRSPSCSASPGTTSWSPSATRARAHRSAGCTRWSEPRLHGCAMHRSPWRALHRSVLIRHHLSGRSRHRHHGRRDGPQPRAAPGLDVRVWNRTRAKAEPLAADGARVADDPAEAVRGRRRRPDDAATTARPPLDDDARGRLRRCGPARCGPSPPPRASTASTRWPRFAARARPASSSTRPSSAPGSPPRAGQLAGPRRRARARPAPSLTPVFDAIGSPYGLGRRGRAERRGDPAQARLQQLGPGRQHTAPRRRSPSPRAWAWTRRASSTPSRADRSTCGYLRAKAAAILSRRLHAQLRGRRRRRRTPG